MSPEDIFITVYCHTSYVNLTCNTCGICGICGSCFEIWLPRRPQNLHRPRQPANVVPKPVKTKQSASKDKAVALQTMLLQRVPIPHKMLSNMQQAEGEIITMMATDLEKNYIKQAMFSY